MASIRWALLCLTALAVVAPQASVIVINEVNSDSPGTDKEEFLELYDTSGGSTSLDGYVVVLFNGNGDKAYTTIDLTGTKTRSNGHFLMGAAMFSPDIKLSNNWLQNGADAVALYRANASQFPSGAAPTQTGLIDVVVYSKYDSVDAGLLQALVPGQNQLKENDQYHANDESLSRCNNKQWKNQSAFILAFTTPGRSNNCTSVPPSNVPTPTSAVPGTARSSKDTRVTSAPPALPAEYLVVNEVNAANPGVDRGEFVELSDGGLGNRALGDYVLVLYQGSIFPPSVHYTINLTGQTTGSNGLFVIGGNNVKADITVPNNNFLLNRAAAVAIHKGNIRDYPKGQKVSAANLVDVVVYNTFGGAAGSLINNLLPGQKRIRELAAFHPADEAISRCYCRKSFLPSFQLEPQTPGQPNNCSGYVRPSPSPIYINELNADTPGTDTHEFVELYDGGVGFSCLDDLTLVFFSAGSSGTDDRAYKAINLSGHKTNKDGYFVIAQPAVKPVSGSADMTIPSSFIQNGADAVALYNVPDGTYVVGTAAKRGGLRDALVYGKSTKTTALKLISTLMPGQEQIHENPNHNSEDESISRCTRCKAPFSQAFTLSKTTAGGPNDCAGFSVMNDPPPSLLINELNSDNPNADRTEFIELYDGGQGGTCLFNMTLVLYNGGAKGNWAGAYKTIDLAQYGTDTNGFLLIGSAEVDPRPDIVLPFYSIQNGADAVVLYRSPANNFPKRSRPTLSGLIDAVVYSYADANATLLLNLLTPGQAQIKEDPNHVGIGDETISRCLSNKTVDLSAFVIAHPTPKDHNNCTIATLPTTTATSLAPVTGAHGTATTTTVQTTTTPETSTAAVSATPATSAIAPSSSSTPTIASTTKGSGRTLSVGTHVTDTTTGVVIVTVTTSTSNTATKPATSSDLSTKTGGRTTSPRFVATTNIARSMLFSTTGQSRTPAPSTPVTSSLVPATSSLLPSVFINEINADQPGLDAREFVELYDNGVGSTRLDGLILVFFNGNGDSSYLTVDLNGNTTNSDGFFVVGSRSVLVNFPAAFSIEIDGGKYGFLQNGPDAVALYHARPTAFPDRTAVTNMGLVDAVVYGTNDKHDTGLLRVLTPGQHQINENYSSLIGDESISRCSFSRPFDQSAYIISTPTPFAKNSCGGNPTSITSVKVVPTTRPTKPQRTSKTATTTPFVANQDAIRHLVISEVNADQPGTDEAEFVELYDGRKGATRMDNVVLVLFNGNFDDRVYRVIDLSGYQTSDEGYFVIGTPAVRPVPDLVINGTTPRNPFLQNGADAVALYSGKVEMFPIGVAKPRPEGLIDVVVYGTGDEADRSLLDVLAPGQSQVNEDWAHHPSGDESISRCSCCQQRNLTTFTVTHPPTPGRANACIKRGINIGLVTSDCSNWMANDTAAVLSYLAQFVSQKCSCSFTVGINLLHDGTAICDSRHGQLVVAAVFVEDTDAHLDRDQGLYDDFLHETQTISVGKVQYQVAPACCSSSIPTASVPVTDNNGNSKVSKGKKSTSWLINARSIYRTILSNLSVIQ